MKTYEEKAIEWIKSQHIIYSDSTVDSLVLLLKKQDRDTRHACAEACINATDNDNLALISTVYHDAVMNCNGGG